jgi:hypothetical protein
MTSILKSDETIRRIRQLHESCGPLTVGASRRDTTSRVRVPKASRSEPQSPRAEKEKAESSQAALRIGRLGNRLLCCLRFFVLLRRQRVVGSTLIYVPLICRLSKLQKSFMPFV